MDFEAMNALARRILGIGGVVILATLSGLPATADVIGLYGDSLGTDCGVPYDFVMPVYVFHYAPSGATGSSFTAPYQSCLTEVEHLSDFSEFSNTVGDSQNGISIQYDACLSGWTHILTIYYWDYTGLGFGACCELPVLPHPSAVSGQIEVTDCQSVALTATGASAIGRKNASCPCEVPTGIPDQRDTSWGVIKALYATGEDGEN